MNDNCKDHKDIRDFLRMNDYDISFCTNESCKNHECFRHIRYVPKNPGAMYSCSDFNGVKGVCPSILGKTGK